MTTKPVSPEVARTAAIHALDARRGAMNALDDVISMVAPSLTCEEKRTPDCGQLTWIHGEGATAAFPYCQACGWTLTDRT